MDQIEPFFDLLQSLGIELDLFQIITQATDQFRQHLVQICGLLGKLGVLGVDLGQAHHGTGGLSYQIGGGR